MRLRQDRLFGILNGIDYEKNNPKTDKRIAVNYDISSIEKKKFNKTELQKQLGLEIRDVPMVGIISRLAEQKGLDLVRIAEEMHQQRCAVCSSGNRGKETGGLLPFIGKQS